MARPTQAVLLAAGPAQRLMPLTNERPKGMLLVGGKPLLQYAVESLVANGVRRIVMVVGAQAERIQGFFKDGKDFGCSIRYASQPKPRGTLDALREALPLLDLKSDCLVASGHLFLSSGAVKPLMSGTGDAVLVAEAKTSEPQPVPRVRGPWLTAVAKGTPVVGSTRVMLGLLRASPGLLVAVDSPSRGAVDLEAFVGAQAGSRRVRTVSPAGPWEPLVTCWDLLRLNEKILDLPATVADKRSGARKPAGRIAIAANAVVAPSAVLIAPVRIGSGCVIGEHSVVGPYVSIRTNSVVGAHCEVRHSILNNNVHVDSFCLVRQSILDDGARLGARTLCLDEQTPDGLRGALLGEDALTGPGAVLRGGTIVQPATTAL